MYACRLCTHVYVRVGLELCIKMRIIPRRATMWLRDVTRRLGENIMMLRSFLLANNEGKTLTVLGKIV